MVMVVVDVIANRRFLYRGVRKRHARIAKFSEYDCVCSCLHSCICCILNFTHSAHCCSFGSALSSTNPPFATTVCDVVFNTGVRSRHAFC